MVTVLKDVSLIKPTSKLKEEYLSFYQEWKESNEDLIPWVISKDPEDFEGMIDFLVKNVEGINLPEGQVPDSTYWLVAKDNQIIGVVNIRHGLTEKLLNSGGHIGYGIRPSERRKGYATQLLALALEKTLELGIKRVLVVCAATNIASIKTIVNNGGMQDKDYNDEDGKIINRFWIEV
jgi:predicted acetyltransferase